MLFSKTFSAHAIINRINLLDKQVYSSFKQIAWESAGIKMKLNKWSFCVEHDGRV